MCASVRTLVMLQSIVPVAAKNFIPRAIYLSSQCNPPRVSVSEMLESLIVRIRGVILAGTIQAQCLYINSRRLKYRSAGISILANNYDIST
jgi:hypothetical protein